MNSISNDGEGNSGAFTESSLPGSSKGRYLESQGSSPQVGRGSQQKLGWDSLGSRETKAAMDTRKEEEWDGGPWVRRYGRFLERDRGRLAVPKEKLPVNRGQKNRNKRLKG